MPAKFRRLFLLVMIVLGIGICQAQENAAEGTASEQKEAVEEPLNGNNSDKNAAKDEEKAAEEKEETDEKAAEEPARPVVLEELPTSQLFAGRLVRLPDANFLNADNIQWSADGKKLLIDRIRNRSFEVVEVEIPDKLDARRFPERVLSEQLRRGGMLHRGTPSWYPLDERYTVFVGQSPISRDYKSSSPLNGQHCDILFNDSKGNVATAIRQHMYSVVRPLGATMPKFSIDGKHLLWCGSNGKNRDLSIWGARSLFVGDFSFKNGVPRLSNVMEFSDPSGCDFVETYGFTADGSKILYGANNNKNTPWYCVDICLMDLKSKSVTKLTNASRSWDRYASFSPKGNKVIWSSSTGMTVVNLGSKGERWQQELKTELWVMNSDGTDKKRLTMFNTRDSRDNRAIHINTYEHAYVGASSWNPKTNQIAMVVYSCGRTISSGVYILNLTNNASEAQQ